MSVSRISVGFGVYVPYWSDSCYLKLSSLGPAPTTSTHIRGHSSPSHSTTKMLTHIRNFICCVHKYQSLTALSWRSDSSFLKETLKASQIYLRLAEREGEKLATCSGEIFGHNRSRSECFQVQPVTCLWPFGISLLIWGIFIRSVLSDP